VFDCFFICIIFIGFFLRNTDTNGKVTTHVVYLADIIQDLFDPIHSLKPKHERSVNVRHPLFLICKNELN
jgi:hypothetical protein